MDVGREKGRKGKKTHKTLAENQQGGKESGGEKKKEHWKSPAELTHGQGGKKAPGQAGKVLGDAAALCPLAGLEKTSPSGTGTQETTAACSPSVRHRNRDRCGSHLLAINSTVYLYPF